MNEDSERGTSTYPTQQELQRRKSSDRVKQLATSAAARTRDALPTERSGLLQWLADRLGKTVDELSEKIPADTVRRTRYPYTLQEDEDGGLTFKDPRIIPGKELQHAPTSPGTTDKQAVERGGVEVRK